MGRGHLLARNGQLLGLRLKLAAASISLGYVPPALVTPRAHGGARLGDLFVGGRQGGTLLLTARGQCRLARLATCRHLGLPRLAARRHRRLRPLALLGTLARRSFGRLPHLCNQRVERLLPFAARGAQGGARALHVYEALREPPLLGRMRLASIARLHHGRRPPRAQTRGRPPGKGRRQRSARGRRPSERFE